MPAGVADDVFLLGGVGDGLVSNSGKGQSLGIYPKSMFAGVVNHDRAIGDGAIKQFVGWSRGRSRAEVGSAEQHFVVGMTGSVGLDFCDERVRIVRSDA